MTDRAKLGSVLSHVAGVFVAANYGLWAIKIFSGPVAAGVGATLSLVQGVVTLPDGRQILPFAVGAPITIGEGLSEEIVSVTAFQNCYLDSPPGNPSVSGTTTKIHGQGEVVQSGSSGLFEACADAFALGGGTVVIDIAWTGTAQDIIDAASLYGSLTITDLR